VSINNNLRMIMAEMRIDNVSELMKRTGLSRNALNKLWHDEDLESVKLETLFQVCDSLQVRLSELIEYHPEQKTTDHK
jgi:putative transcriptional regulator